jgi:hypothetical protein
VIGPHATAERGLKARSPTKAGVLRYDYIASESLKCCRTWNCAGGRPALANKDIWHTVNNLYI